MFRLTAVLIAVVALVVPGTASALTQRQAHDRAVAVVSNEAQGLEQYGTHDLSYQVDRCQRVGHHWSCVYGMIATASSDTAQDGSCLSAVIVRRSSAASMTLSCTPLFKR